MKRGSKNWRKKISDSVKKTFLNGRVPFWLNKKRDERTKEKIKKTKIKQLRENKKLLEILRKTLEKARKNPQNQILATIAKNKTENRRANSERRKLYYQNHPEAREKQRKIAIEVRKKLGEGKETKIEKIMRQELEKTGLNFESCSAKF